MVLAATNGGGEVLDDDSFWSMFLNDFHVEVDQLG